MAAASWAPEVGEGHGEVLPVDIRVYLLKLGEPEDNRGCFKELHNQKVGQKR